MPRWNDWIKRKNFGILTQPTVYFLLSCLSWIYNKKIRIRFSKIVRHHSFNFFALLFHLDLSDKHGIRKIYFRFNFCMWQGSGNRKSLFTLKSGPEILCRYLWLCIYLPATYTKREISDDEHGYFIDENNEVISYTTLQFMRLA